MAKLLQTIDQGAPPSATLEVNGSLQVAGTGSYCWVSFCVDTMGLGTAREPLVTGRPFIGHFHLALDQPPETLYLEMVPVTPVDEEKLDVTLEWRYWHWHGGAVLGTDLEPGSDAQYEFDQPSGLYLIMLAPSWRYLGNAAYGFLVQVEMAPGDR